MSRSPEEILLSEEQPVRQLTGRMRTVVNAILFLLACLSLYWTQYSIGTTEFRSLFLLFVLVLSFLLYPVLPSSPGRDRVQWIDWLLVAL